MREDRKGEQLKALSERRKKWAEEHDRLSRLFVEDRLTFERERKRRIEKTITGGHSAAAKIRLRELQKNWDKILTRAGSPHNRFVLIQMLFWNQVRDVWSPALNDYENRLRWAFRGRRS